MLAVWLTSWGPDGVINHLVLFQLPHGSEPDSVDVLVSEIQYLVSEEDAAKDVTIRRDLGLRPWTHRGAQVMALIRFDDSSGFETYLAGDAHERFLDEVANPLGVSILSIQMEEDEVVGGPVGAPRGAR